ncbi:hypothetical protein IAT40_003947 [Kwoniella sp. CBS 6097]
MSKRKAPRKAASSPPSSFLIPPHILFSLLFLLAISTQAAAFTFPFISSHSSNPKTSTVQSKRTLEIEMPHTAHPSLTHNQQRNHRSRRSHNNIDIDSVGGGGKPKVVKNGYLSSTKRVSEPNRFGIFSFARQPKNLPPWDPLNGVEGVLVHRSSPSFTPAPEPESLLHPMALAFSSGSPNKPVSAAAGNVDEEIEEYEDEFDDLVERDGEVDLEDCEKREEGVNEPTPIAQLGNIPESQLQAGLQSLTADANATATDAISGLLPGLLGDSASSSDLNVNPGSGSEKDRKYGEKVLWSGLMNELGPLAAGGSLIKRHRDKSGRHGSNGWTGADDDDDEGSNKGRGRHGNANGHGGYGDDSDSDGEYGRGQKHGGSGWHDGGDNDNDNDKGWHHGSGRGGGRGGGGGGGGGNGGWKNGKGRPGWQNHQSDYHHSSNDDGSSGRYDSGSGSGSGSGRASKGNYHNDESQDQGWHHPSNGGNGGNGDGGGSRGKHGYDDGQYHPWKDNHGYNPDSDSSSGSGYRGGHGKWDNHGSGGSEEDNNGSGSSNMKGDEDWVASPSSYDDSNPNSDSDADTFSAQAQAGSSTKYTGGGAHRLAQSAYGTPARSDCSRLMQFYRASSRLDGGWVNDRGWVDENDDQCCDWYGVSCDPVSRRVTALELRNNGLSGVLSNYLFALNALMRVDLSKNSLVAFPDRFTPLPKLTHLNLSSSGLSGPIPSSLLSSSPALINVDLSKNNLTGHLEISGPNIHVVNVMSNQLESIIVDSFNSPTSGATGLSKLVIADNKFQGPLPDLSRIEGLSVFDASNNNTGSIFDISNLNNLTRLDLRSNQLTGSFPSPLPSSLQSLYLSSNSLSGPIPQITAPESLSACYILSNAIDCPTDAELADPTSLASVCHLRNCAKLAAAAAASATSASNTDQTPAAGAGAVANTIGAGHGSKGIPVNPLPGEVMGLPGSSSSSSSGSGITGPSNGQIVSGDAWPGIQSQSQPSSASGSGNTRSNQGQGGRPLNSSNMANGKVGSQGQNGMSSSAFGGLRGSVGGSKGLVFTVISVFLVMSLGVL